MTRLERAVQTILGRVHQATPEMIELSAAWRASIATPICYPDRDLSRGLSWDGNVICGDAKSIKAVKTALYRAADLELYAKLLREEQEAHERTRDENLVLRGKIENAKAALHVDF